MDKNTENNLQKGMKWIQGHSEEISLAAAAASRAASKKRKTAQGQGSETVLKGVESALDRAAQTFGDLADKAQEEAVEAGTARAWSPVKVLVAGIAIGFAVGFIASRDN